MHMRAGRQAGRADEADDLALPHFRADVEALGESRHVAVSGFVAVGVADADIFAVAALEPDLLDFAVAGGEDRRAEWRAPIDAGMQLADMKERMGAPAERRRLHADRDGFAHQEFLGALAGLV